MSELFEERRARANSTGKRSKVYGVGINDSDYITQYTESGVRYICPYYARWVSMLERGYSARWKLKQPTYEDCSVSEEWHLFSTFRLWMEEQDWEGKFLDKDMICLGNKVYSKENCVFVSREINNLLVDRARDRGELPQGVHFHDKTGKYRARISLSGKRASLGLFNCKWRAYVAYCTAKYIEIARVANLQEASSQPKLRAGLLAHAEIFKTRSEARYGD